MGIFAREGYEDKLTVAYIGIMNHINDLVEREQHDDRPTIVITDEGHIITTNPLLAPYVVIVYKDVAKIRLLALACHPEPGGFPRCLQEDAEYDGVVALPGNAQGGSGANCKIQISHRWAAHHAAISAWGDGEVRGRSGAIKYCSSSVP